MDQRVRISLHKRTAELLEDGEVVARRAFSADDKDQPLYERALKLVPNDRALVALLWPERLDSSGHQT